MLRRLRDWLSGWYVTLDIRFRNPELYRQLVSNDFDPDDFVEVREP